MSEQDKSENLRAIILEMRDSKDPYVRDLERRICQALNRDCYCPWCGRTLGHKPSEEFYDKETGEPKDPMDKKWTDNNENTKQ